MDDLVARYTRLIEELQTSADPPLGLDELSVCCFALNRVITNAKATLNYRGNAASCRQERIKICECPMPTSASNRTRGLLRDIHRRSLGRLNRPYHHVEMKFCISELQFNACPQFFVHE